MSFSRVSIICASMVKNCLLWIDDDEIVLGANDEMEIIHTHHANKSPHHAMHQHPLPHDTSYAPAPEPLFLEGQLRALHNVGAIGEKWYVNLSILDGMFHLEKETELVVGPRLRETFARQVVGPLDDLKFCIKLDGLDTESLAYMRRVLVWKCFYLILNQ